MTKKSTWFSGSDRGGAGIWVIIVGLLLGGTIYAASILGPVYNTKWEMEDKIEELVRRTRSLGEEGIFEQLDLFVQEKKYPIDVYEQCEYQGEVGSPGFMQCSWVQEVKFPGYVWKKTIVARYQTNKIPWDSY